MLEYSFFCLNPSPPTVFEQLRVFLLLTEWRVILLCVLKNTERMSNLATKIIRAQPVGDTIPKLLRVRVMCTAASPLSHTI